jgi:hypothetical protein
MRTLLGLAGLCAVALGGLWLLQGLDLVHMKPVLCAADCTPLNGPSRTWTVIGAVVATLGAATIFLAFKRR